MLWQTMALSSAEQHSQEEMALEELSKAEFNLLITLHPLENQT